MGRDDQSVVLVPHMPWRPKPWPGGQAATPRIAIVGRGFTGAAAAAALLRRRAERFSLVMIDETSTLGGGLAYGAARAGELLNVRARDLSLVAEDRGDFADWLLGNLTGGDPGARVSNVGQIFAPRALFADYVKERLEVEILNRPDCAVQIANGSAIGLDRRGEKYVIRFDDGEDIGCDAVILATGYGAGEKRFLFGDDPFGRVSEDAVISASSVVLVGSGLTMVDVLLRLRRMGCPAPVTIISRRGLVPQAQLKLAPQAEPWRKQPAQSAAQLLHEIRRACDEAVRFGDPWQGVLNGIRPEAQRLWRALPAAEQRRFLRHCRAYWDIHRHRLPPDIHLQLKLELDRPRTVVRAGHVLAVNAGKPHEIAVRWRGQTAVETLQADLVFDCSGHAPDLSSRLPRDAIRNGLARMDAHGISLDVDDAGRVAGANGGRDDTLFALGPLGAGALLEITAAPEIAFQAQTMAEVLCTHSVTRFVPVRQKRLGRRRGQ